MTTALMWLPQVWEGDGVVASARKMIGATNPLQSEPGTIRGDFAIQVRNPCGNRYQKRL
jgi:nucleoside diphosphate kinase